MDEQAIRGHLRALGVGPVTKQRGWLNAPCPLAPWNHRAGKDSSPSFGIEISTSGHSHYYCFTCKNSGRVHDLAAELGRLRGHDYTAIQRQAVRDDILSIPSYEGFTDTPRPPEPLDSAEYEDLYEPVEQCPEAIAYLSSRRVSLETARILGLSYDPEDHRLVFPVRDRAGGLFGYTGRSIDPPGCAQSGRPKVKDYLGLPKRHLLLGEERVEYGKPIIVVEGLFGYARLVEIGAERLASVVALLGSEMTAQKADRLRRINAPTYLLVDDDEAGDVCLWGVVRNGEHSGEGAISKLLGHVPVVVPAYPEGVGDVDDFTFQDLCKIMEEARQITP